MKNKRFVLIGIVLFICGLTLFCGGKVSAYTLIEQKALGKGIYDCYVVALTNKSEHVLVGKTTIGSVTEGYKSLILANDEDYVGLPSGFGWQSIGDNNVSCRELFGGYRGGNIGGGTFDGLLNRAGINGMPNTRDEKINLLVNVFGYKASSEVVSSGGGCLRIKIKVWNPGDMYAYSEKESAAICSSKGAITEDSVSIQGANLSGVLEFYKKGSTIEIAKVACTDTSDPYCQNDDGEFLVTKKINISDYSSFDELVNAIGGDIIGHFSGANARVSEKRASIDPTNFLNKYSYDESNDVEYTIANTRTANNNRANAAFVAAGRLLGASFKRKEDMIFSDEEKYSLYNEYLKSFYEAFPPICEYGDGVGTTEESLKNGGYLPISYNQNGEVMNCYIKASKHTDSKNNNQDKAYGIDGNGYFGELKTFDQIVEEFSGLVKKGVDSDGEVPVAESQDAKSDKCYDSKIGWFVCPLITTSISLLNDVYDDVENNYLKIPAEDFFKKDSGGQGVYDTWDVFRNIANVAFIILLLVVIFSQLTGVGIDNYGVKKILPRIIIAAVLINLSYVVCQLAVDISNVIGVSVNNMFEGLVQNAGLGEVTGNYTASAAQYVVTFGGLGVISLATLLISPGLIVTVLLFLVSAVIAVLFLWIILIARQAGVVLAVVLSPLAFAFYILPNTNKVFKLWASVSKALLLLYPLCALAVGSGLMAGRVLASISAGSGSMGLAAMVVQVVPYFFIPALLKGSLATMGNVGAKISGLGRSLNKATVGRFASSDTAKRARIALNNSDSTGFRTALANTKFGRFTGLSKVRARQIGAANKEKEERLEHGRLLQATISDKQEGMHPEEYTQEKFQERLNKAIQSGDEYQYFGLLDDSLRRFGLSKATKMHRKAIENAGMNGLMSEGSRGKFLRNASERYEAFGTKDFGLGKYMQFGGRNERGEIAELDGFERNVLKPGDLKDAQAITLNADSIERAIKSGLATQAMAKRLMASKQARNQMDDVQLLIWSKFAEDGDNNSPLTKTQAEDALRGNPGAALSSDDVRRLTEPLPEEVRIAGQQQPPTP